MVLSLPGVEEGTSYGTPAFRVGGKMLLRFHQDGESLVIPVEFAARDVLMGARPDTFYVTDHYRCYPLMLARLSTVDRDDLSRLLEEAWRRRAPKRLLAAHDSERG
ncbi:MAG TPA: MmcQ/YjbR family DNA-binding protein [Blastocatellia bacterium]|nr:MmcQ/YjbR family DNA-binding protein [Blastocatellia bacterium]